MNWLRGRLFGLPVWGWILLVAGVAAAIMLYTKNKKNNAGSLSSDTTGTPVGVTPTTLSPQYNYYYNGDAAQTGNGQWQHSWDHSGYGTGSWTTGGGTSTPGTSDNTPASAPAPSVAQTTFAPAATNTDTSDPIALAASRLENLVQSGGLNLTTPVATAPSVSLSPAPAVTPVPTVISTYTNPAPMSYAQPAGTSKSYSSGYGSGKQIA